MKKKFIQFIIVTFGSLTCYCQGHDRWYILSLGDKPVGYYHDISRKIVNNNEQIVRSEVSFKMSLSRLGSQVDMQSTVIQKENARGKLLGILSETLFSKQKSSIRVRIGKDKIEITTSTGGKEINQEVKNADILTGMERLQFLTGKKLNKPGDSIVYKTFFAEYNRAIEGVRKFVTKENIEIAGKIIPVIRATEGFRDLPMQRELWFDNKGLFVKLSESNPYGQLTLVLSNKNSSIKAASGKVELSEDQYAATLVRSNVRLPQSREINSVTIKIKLKNPSAGFPDLTGSYQQILEKGDDYVVLKIWRPKIGEKTGSGDPGYKNQFLAVNSFLNKDDSLIIKTMKQVVGRETDPFNKAILIRNWVAQNMKFNAGIALAPSSEVIRNLEGTCASFATITTTLCRAAGIPSRYLMGYIYVDGIWGGHAWTEIYIDNSWIPIDAAMPSPTGIADAARFHYIRSSMNNGPGECFVGGQQLYSNVNIEILDYALNDNRTSVGGKAFEVSDEGYSNAGLGISMKGIKNFEFCDTGNVYPENILFSLQNKDSGEAVRLFQYSLTPRYNLVKQINIFLEDGAIHGVPQKTSYNGNLSFKASEDDKSAMAIINGSDIYVMVAKGKSSESLLEHALSLFDYKKFPAVNY